MINMLSNRPIADNTSFNLERPWINILETETLLIKPILIFDHNQNNYLKIS